MNQLEIDIEAGISITDKEKLQKHTDFIGHKYESPYVTSTKGKSIIKPLIKRYYAGEKLQDKELELLFMLSMPKVDVDLFPNETITINNLESELGDLRGHDITTKEIMDMANNYLREGLLIKNPLYDINALRKFRSSRKE